MMPADAALSTQGIVGIGGLEPMLPPLKMLDWARYLLDRETDAAILPLQTGSPTIRVYEKLRHGICPFVGVDGFQMLATRALAVAKATVSGLATAQIAAGGELCGFGGQDSESEPDKHRDVEAGVIFVAHLFGLFLILLGPLTTKHLVQTVFPSLDAASKPGVSTPFENMLQEASQLRSVSERLAALADEHPDVEDGLAGISGNIRDIATILDVFAAIKRRSEEAQEGEMSLQATRYLM
jgi:hypothetical protein